MCDGPGFVQGTSLFPAVNISRLGRTPFPCSVGRVDFGRSSDRHPTEHQRFSIWRYCRITVVATYEGVLGEVDPALIRSRRETCRYGINKSMALVLCAEINRRGIRRPYE